MLRSAWNAWSHRLVKDSLEVAPTSNFRKAMREICAGLMTSLHPAPGREGQLIISVWSANNWQTDCQRTDDLHRNLLAPLSQTVNIILKLTFFAQGNSIPERGWRGPEEADGSPADRRERQGWHKKVITSVVLFFWFGEICYWQWWLTTVEKYLLLATLYCCHSFVVLLALHSDFYHHTFHIQCTSITVKCHWRNSPWT